MGGKNPYPELPKRVGTRHKRQRRWWNEPYKYPTGAPWVHAGKAPTPFDPDSPTDALEVVRNRGKNPIRRPAMLSELMSRICVSAGAPVVRGQYNMQMIAVRDLPQVVRYIANNHRTLGFDRTSLVIWLMGIENDCDFLKYTRHREDEGTLHTMDIGYDHRLELEVHRISRLDEPERTIAAVEFVRRLLSAKTLTEVAEKCFQDQMKRDVIKVKGRKTFRTHTPRHPDGADWWKRLMTMAEGRGDELVDGR